MPSPVGHGLAAVAAGWLVARPAPTARERWTQCAILAATAAAPDLDLLIGQHSGVVHSIGAAAIVASVAAAMRWPVVRLRQGYAGPSARSRALIWLSIFAAWASHPLLDALGEDSSPPIGVMALWPFSRRYFHSGLDIFNSIYRNWRAPGIITHNAAAIARELAILLPVVLIVWLVRRRRFHAGYE